MDTKRFDELLRETLEDARMSRSERRTLRAAVDAAGADEQLLAQLRARVFAIAREHALDGDADAVLRWAESAIKQLLPAPTAVGGERADVYFSPGDDCVGVLRELIGKARRTIDVCVFTVTDDRVTDALRRARDRGVRLRIVTDDEKAWDPGSDVRGLKRDGVPVKHDASRHHMHHKYAVFDGSVAVSGSYNWTRSAAEHNHENLVVSDDARIVGAFEANFEALWRTL